MLTITVPMPIAGMKNFNKDSAAYSRMPTQLFLLADDAELGRTCSANGTIFTSDT